MPMPKYLVKSLNSLPWNRGPFSLLSDSGIPSEVNFYKGQLTARKYLFSKTLYMVPYSFAAVEAFRCERFDFDHVM